MFKNNVRCAIGLATMLVANASLATTIDAFDHGWYESSGSHGTSNTNIWTGSEGTYSLTRHFMAFDLAAMSGQTVTSATLTYSANIGKYASENSSEHITVSDYTGDIDSLLGGSAGSGAYTDLGDGSIYGTAVVTGTPVAPGSGGSGDFMPEIIISLSAAAIADINAAIAAADQRLALGTMVTNATYGQQQKLWWGSGQIPAAFLTLDTTPVASASAPATTMLALTALVLVLRLRRR